MRRISGLAEAPAGMQQWRPCSKKMEEKISGQLQMPVSLVHGKYVPTKNKRNFY